MTSVSRCSLLAGVATLPSQWGPAQNMTFGRMTANAVLTPNGDIVAIGGCAEHYFVTLAVPNPPRTPVLTTEVWDKVNGWTVDDTQFSPRMYHSTGALLRSGRIVSGGGDIRHNDWEI